MNGTVFLDCGGDYKVGDPMPDGYIQRQEWAAVHMKAGLKQEECSTCMRWQFPHQLSDRIVRTPCIRETRVNRRKHFEPSEIISRFCVECEASRGVR